MVNHFGYQTLLNYIITMINQFYKKIFIGTEKPTETKEYITNIGILKFDLTTHSFYAENNTNVNSLVKYWMKEMFTFEECVEPAINFLFKNYHPHTSIHIDYDTAELLMGVKVHNLSDYVPD